MKFIVCKNVHIGCMIVSTWKCLEFLILRNVVIFGFVFFSLKTFRIHIFMHALLHEKRCYFRIYVIFHEWMPQTYHFEKRFYFLIHVILQESTSQIYPLEEYRRSILLRVYEESTHLTIYFFENRLAKWQHLFHMFPTFPKFAKARA